MVAISYSSCLLQSHIEAGNGEVQKNIELQWPLGLHATLISRSFWSTPSQTNQGVVVLRRICGKLKCKLGCLLKAHPGTREFCFSPSWFTSACTTKNGCRQSPDPCINGTSSWRNALTQKMLSRNSCELEKSRAEDQWKVVRKLVQKSEQSRHAEEKAVAKSQREKRASPFMHCKYPS